jgi:endonuclease YncB( thermonuclease family)
MRPLALFLALLLISRVAAGAEVSGIATAKDGDSLLVAGIDIRLYGIDAPEWRQQCANGQALYACGQDALRALASRVNGKTVRCEQIDYDAHYQRPVSRCFVGEEDVGRWMVAQGLAIAYVRYSALYAAEEAGAKAAELGLWRGTFVAPEEWRRGARLAQEGDAADGPTLVLRDESGSACTIKGNISGNGERIYHVPGQQHYAGTRIDPGRGERWFCTEAEAVAAGWRRARQ